MSRRRFTCLLVAVFLCACAVWGVIRWRYPALSSAEWQLLGRWAIPEFDSRQGYVTNLGPVTHPWRVWEFRRDRSFRIHIVSADDPRVDIIDMEGHWRIKDGQLVVSGEAGGIDFVREARERIRIWFGRPYTRTITGQGRSLPIRFLGHDMFVLTTPGKEGLTWKRRP